MSFQIIVTNDEMSFQVLTTTSQICLWYLMISPVTRTIAAMIAMNGFMSMITFRAACARDHAFTAATTPMMVSVRSFIGPETRNLMIADRPVKNADTIGIAILARALASGSRSPIRCSTQVIKDDSSGISRSEE